MLESKKLALNSIVSAEVHAVLAQRPELTVAEVAKGNWTFLFDRHTKTFWGDRILACQGPANMR